MVDAATAVLTSRGVAQRDIHADAFHPANNHQEGRP
jgi:hypothetical protein